MGGKKWDGILYSSGETAIRAPFAYVEYAIGDNYVWFLNPYRQEDGISIVGSKMAIKEVDFSKFSTLRVKACYQAINGSACLGFAPMSSTTWQTQTSVFSGLTKYALISGIDIKDYSIDISSYKGKYWVILAGTNDYLGVNNIWLEQDGE